MDLVFIIMNIKSFSLYHIRCQFSLVKSQEYDKYIFIKKSNYVEVLN